MTIASRCKANITAWKISPNDSTLRDTERSTRWLTLTTPCVSCYDTWEGGQDISEGSSCLPNTQGGGQRRNGVGRTEWVGECRQSLSEPSQPYNLEIKDTTSSCRNNNFKWLISLFTTIADTLYWQYVCVWESQLLTNTDTSDLMENSTKCNGPWTLWIWICEMSCITSTAITWSHSPLNGIMICRRSNCAAQ